MGDTAGNTISNFQITNATSNWTNNIVLGAGSHKIANATMIFDDSGDSIYVSAFVGARPSGTGQQNAVFTINSTLAGCNSTKERTFDDDNDLGNIGFGKICANNPSKGDAYEVSLWANVEAGETLNITDESLSGFEIYSFDLATINTPPVVAIETPGEETNVSAEIDINWSVSDSQNDPTLTNISATRGATTITIATNVFTSNTSVRWDTSEGINGEWNLTVLSAENETTDLFQGSETHVIYIINPNPNVTDLTEAPTDPATYSSSGLGTYGFNATVVDGTIDAVILEFNGINYTANNHSGNIYNVTLPINVGVGVWNYTWYVNNTGGLVNNTEGGSYTVVQTTSTINLTLNGVNANSTGINGTFSYLNVSTIDGDAGAYLSLYNNGTLINNGTSPIFNATQFNFTGLYNITGCYQQSENFTGVCQEYYLNISFQDVFPPTWTNLRNFTIFVNQSFTETITATDQSGIDTYFLNQTDVFNISKTTGLISNVTAMTNVSIWYLNISVNDTIGNLLSGVFYINITNRPPTACNETITVLQSASSNKRPYGRLCYWLDFR